MGKPTKSDVEFVKTYSREDLSNQGVAEALGMTYNNVMTRVKNLRAAGVKLPKKARAKGGKRHDVKGLNALLSKPETTEESNGEAAAILDNVEGITRVAAAVSQEVAEGLVPKIVEREIMKHKAELVSA